MKDSAVAPSGNIASKFYLGWFLYFMLMIAIVGTAFAYVLSMPFFLMGLVWRPAHRLGGRILRVGIAILMGVEPWLRAETNVPEHPKGITVSNHRSHLDAFILLSRIPGVRLVCKDSLLRVPFLGLMIRLGRHIPIRSGSAQSYYQAMEKVREGIRAGDAVHVFPEMTRCPPGWQGTMKFHLAPFHVAFQEKIPVTPIVFRGTDAAWPKGRMALSFRQPVSIQTLEPIDPSRFPSAEALSDEARRRINDCLAEVHA